MEANHLATILLAFDDSDRVTSLGKCRETVFCGVTQTETFVDSKVPVYTVADPLISGNFDIHFVERIKNKEELRS